MGETFTKDDGQIHCYEIEMPPFGWLPKEKIEALPAQYLDKLMPHAWAFACLDGNAFEQSVPYYLPEAYANLWSNSCLDDIPNLYPATASDTLYAALNDDDELYRNHEGYIRLGKEGRAVIRAQFKEGWLEKRNEVEKQLAQDREIII